VTLPRPRLLGVKQFARQCRHGIPMAVELPVAADTAVGLIAEGLARRRFA
jgi:hypothetical protein